ncbi:MAG: hypothetical protein QOG62_2837 [Thermoleophilaceae bacterium]|jgi:hypothetical protein|nr:hypothetical protein [Thermoleophilaceae bacterium]
MDDQDQGLQKQKADDGAKNDDNPRPGEGTGEGVRGAGEQTGAAGGGEPTEPTEPTDAPTSE